ncbi:hypothetical protein WICMUC_005464 [Wickerhamomyces mucosus]|uniref:Fork-head domain-containing protein n=1 Tax=Wickerhamomyces mucosus TaxID=1378264 RepID=A0A9P8P8A0_9ASCO|nr:hypothetical protein WICMUC_005464 [Wickerhamomyces mucosus]
MQSNQDLNSNLIKSLTSVYLPPPPSHSTNQISKTDHKVDPTMLAKNGKETMISAGSDIVAKKKKLKRTSSTTEELLLPLNTPPHSISRKNNSSNESSRKDKIQDTPTLKQERRLKNNQKPLSPQYSSPNSSISNIPISKSDEKETKPPQPSFTSSKPKTILNKQQKLYEDFELPLPSKMPKIVYDSDTKPPYSYATLIGMAILRGEHRKLTLSQIYNWISSTFKFYKKDELGWQNSIRHNLSLNKAFVKQGRSSDGKGHYWEIVKGYEMQFVRGKTGKKMSAGNQLKPEFKKKEIAKSDSSDDEDQEGKTKISSTPKNQIRSTEFDERPSLKKSNTIIGMHNFPFSKIDFSLDSEDDSEDQEDPLPRKKQQFRAISAAKGDLTNNIPSLEAPDTNWAASASGHNIVFGQAEPGEIAPMKTSFTSSFSCNTNLEMSPLRRQETGPLLEPLTPSSRLASFAANPNSITSTVNKTPLRNNNNINNTSNFGNSTQGNRFYNFIKTPVNRIRTPNSNSIMKKFWNSPAFIDDFYTSPSVQRTSNDHEDSFAKRLFGSPEIRRTQQSSQVFNLQNEYFSHNSDSKRSQFLEHSTNYGTGFSDMFGIDICSVVQRAVENEKNSAVAPSSISIDSENATYGALNDNVSTEEDSDNN